MNTDNRKLLIFWSADNDSSTLTRQRIDIQLSTYMSFDGNFSKDQSEFYSCIVVATLMVTFFSVVQTNCMQQYGFWCTSGVEVCINAQMRCDQADSCFDGGSDEAGCPSPRNVTSHGCEENDVVVCVCVYARGLQGPENPGTSNLGRICHLELPGNFNLFISSVPKQHSVTSIDNHRNKYMAFDNMLL